MAYIQKKLYLIHDLTTLEDEKIMLLDEKFSHVGYSIYWRLLEYMQKTENCEILFDGLELISKRLLASKYDDVKAVLDYCIKIGLFIEREDKKAFYSKRLQENRAEMEAKSQTQRDKANKRWQCNGNATAMQRQCNGNANKNKNKNKNNNNNKNKNNNTSCIEQMNLLNANESEADKKDVTIPEELTDFSLPLNDGTTFIVPKKDFEQWHNLYPAVDVMQELRNMIGWLDANTTKRKTRKGIKTFINNWLTKVQNKGSIGNNNYIRWNGEPVPTSKRPCGDPTDEGCPF